ncbi:MAG: hypothetical protein Fur0025_33010 [Oscillatoriaceae cyanobacterium]
MNKPAQTWNESLAIGLPLIDMQHKQLLDQMDALVEALNNKQDLKQLENLLSYLDMYVNNHFGYEEQCMNLKKCPVAGKNQESHQYFKTRLAGIRQMIKEPSSESLSRQVSVELRDWFVKHISTIDMKLAAVS